MATYHYPEPVPRSGFSNGIFFGGNGRRNCMLRAFSRESLGTRLLAGYECSFVDSPSKDLQSECSICLQVLREPYLGGCCGYRFCRACIEPIQNRGRPCPLCNKKFSSLPDKQLERILNQKLVYCSHKDGGCKWEGILAQLEDHLNPKPHSPQNSKCYHHKAMLCHLCNSRYFSADHLKTCPSRIVTCAHCKVHEDTFFRLQSEHNSECPMYPVECPNACGAKTVRKDIITHLDDECPLTVLECDFKFAGCEVEVKRKDMKDHLNDYSSKHVELAKYNMTNMKEEIECLKDQLIGSSAEENEKLRDKLRETEMVGYINECAMKSPVKFISVTNLAYCTNEDMLKSVFGQFGSVASVGLDEDLGLATIQYHHEDSARNALLCSAGRGINLKSNRLCLSPVF